MCAGDDGIFLWPLVAVSPSNLARILPWMYATYLDVSTCVKFLNGLWFHFHCPLYLYVSAFPSGDINESIK